MDVSCDRDLLERGATSNKRNEIAGKKLLRVGVLDLAPINIRPAGYPILQHSKKETKEHRTEASLVYAQERP